MRAVMMGGGGGVGRNGSLLVWCCDQDQSPQSPSVPGSHWHVGVGSAVPLFPVPAGTSPQAYHYSGLGGHSIVVG